MIAGKTERLVLEPISMRHADGLFAALHHDAVDAYLLAPDAASLDQVRARLARLTQEPAPPGEVWLNFAMMRAGEVIGRIEATSYGAWAEIAYLLGPHHQRQGFAREAVRWLVDNLYAAGCSDVWAAVHPENARSIALLRALGFEQRLEPRRSLQSYDLGDAVFEHAPR